MSVGFANLTAERPVHEHLCRLFEAHPEKVGREKKTARGG